MGRTYAGARADDLDVGFAHHMSGSHIARRDKRASGKPTPLFFGRKHPLLAVSQRVPCILDRRDEPCKLSDLHAEPVVRTC